MNHLQKAIELMESSNEGVFQKYSLRQLQAQQATAHALIALTQRVDQLLERNSPAQKHTEDRVYDPSISGWRAPRWPSS